MQVTDRDAHQVSAADFVFHADLGDQSHTVPHDDKTHDGLQGGEFHIHVQRESCGDGRLQSPCRDREKQPRGARMNAANNLAAFAIYNSNFFGNCFSCWAVIPVIMTVFTPACFAFKTASLTSILGGSCMAAKPTKIKFVSQCLRLWCIRLWAFSCKRPL